MRGFGCESRAVQWVAVLSRKTVWTCVMCRSEWRVRLETHHGALVIVLSSVDWYRWVTDMLDLETYRQAYSLRPHYGRNEMRKSCTINNSAQSRPVEVNILLDWNQCSHIKNNFNIYDLCEIRHAIYNVILRRVRVTIVAVEKQYVLRILIVFL